MEMLIDAENTEYPGAPVNPYRKLLGTCDVFFLWILLKSYSSSKLYCINGDIVFQGVNSWEFSARTPGDSPLMSKIVWR